MTTRCPWAKNDLAAHYHDTEWGVPRRDDRTLFEFLILEGAQAGLSWDTILKKRDAYRAAFNNFDAAKVAAFGPDDAARLLANPGIVRNRLKVQAAITNARATLALADKGLTLSTYLWGFVDNTPVVNLWTDLAQVPSRTPLSDTLSKSLKSHGFTFVGTTICYAFMQAVGMVNDHLVSCPRHAALTLAPKAPPG